MLRQLDRMGVSGAVTFLGILSRASLTRNCVVTSVILQYTNSRDTFLYCTKLDICVSFCVTYDLRTYDCVPLLPNRCPE